MLYPTLNQPLMIVILIAAGFVGGLIFDLVKICSLLCCKSKIVKHCLDFSATILIFAFIFWMHLKYNYGQFRFYVILLFFVSFSIEKIFAKFLWTKLLQKWYSSIVQRRKEVGKRKEEQNN